jgi:hypothetical protein
MGRARSTHTIAYILLVGKSVDIKPARRRPRRANIKTDLRERGLENLNWIHLAEYRYQQRDLVNTAMKLRFP